MEMSYISVTFTLSMHFMDLLSLILMSHSAAPVASFAGEYGFSVSQPTDEPRLVNNDKPEMNVTKSVEKFSKVVKVGD